MVRMLFIGILMVFLVSTCSSAAIATPGARDGPVLASIDRRNRLAATPELPSTATPLSQQSLDLEYSSVAEALTGLKTRDDVSIADLKGWTIVTEADGKTTWCFVPPDHPAYPAVAKRILYTDQDGPHLRMDILCEADAAACDELVRYFEILNEPINRLIEEQREP